MVQDTNKLFLTEELWRQLLSGKSHQTLSIALSEGFGQLLSFCNSEGLIVDPKELVNKLSVLDSNDLSDTTKLITSRFETIFKNQLGKPRYLNIAQCINQAVYDRSADQWKTDIINAKVLNQKASELENISRSLKHARNVNAHSNKEILDLGFSLTLFAACTRLFELFDYKNVKTQEIDLIKNSIERELITASIREENNGRKISASNNLLSKTYLNKNSNHVRETKPKRESLTPIGSSNNVDDPNVPFDQSINSSELEKQNLIRLRYEIFKYFREHDIVLDRKHCFLSGSALTDILLYKPTDVENLKNVLSVKIIANRSPRTAAIQIEKFGEKITEVF